MDRRQLEVIEKKINLIGHVMVARVASNGSKHLNVAVAHAPIKRLRIE